MLNLPLFVSSSAIT